jgi:hypothetical protein
VTETEVPDAETLRAAIVQRWGSVHRFCRLHKGRLNRATVYMVLAGKYPGSLARQAQRIYAVLTGAKDAEGQVMAAIKGVACAKCSVTTRPCDRCDGLFRSQAAAAARVLISSATF